MHKQVSRQGEAARNNPMTALQTHVNKGVGAHVSKDQTERTLALQHRTHEFYATVERFPGGPMVRPSGRPWECDPLARKTARKDPLIER